MNEAMIHSNQGFIVGGLICCGLMVVLWQLLSCLLVGVDIDDEADVVVVVAIVDVVDVVAGTVDVVVGFAVVDHDVGADG